MLQRSAQRIHSLSDRLAQSAQDRDAAATELLALRKRLTDARTQLQAQQDTAAAEAAELAVEHAAALAGHEVALKARDADVAALRVELAHAESGARQSSQLHADLLATRAAQVAWYEEAAVVRCPCSGLLFRSGCWSGWLACAWGNC